MSNVPVWEKYLMWAMLVAAFVINIVIISMSANAKSSLDDLRTKECPHPANAAPESAGVRRLADYANTISKTDQTDDVITVPEGTGGTELFCGVFEFADNLYGTVLSTILGSQIGVLVIIMFSAVYWTFIYRKLMTLQGYKVEGIEVNRIAQLLAIVLMAVGYLLQFVVYGMVIALESSAKFTSMKWLLSNGIHIKDIDLATSADDTLSNTDAKNYLKQLQDLDNDVSTLHALVLTLVILKTLQLVLGHGWAVSMTKQD